jgi:hypothetical protein
MPTAVVPNHAVIFVFVYGSPACWVAPLWNSVHAPQRKIKQALLLREI